MNEIWKDIKGYEGLYQVSNLGRIKSLSNRSNHKNPILMKQACVLGYMVVSLTKDSVPKMFKVHRLVASAFIENKENKADVNHKDGNKKNNNVNNLEWCTAQENVIHAFKTGLSKAQKGKENSRSIIISQIDKNTGKEVNVFYGTREAERKTGIKHSNISRCCKGKYKSAGGFKWKYKKIMSV